VGYFGFWGLVWVLDLVCCIGLFTFCTCEKFPCCPCCKRKKLEKGKKVPKWPVFGVFCTSFCTIVLVMFGMSTAISTLSGMKKINCSAIGMVHELMWGADNNGTKWLGMTGVGTSIGNIIIDLKTTLPNKITARFSDNAWIATDYPALVTELEAIYTKFKAVTVTNPDPTGPATKIPTMFE